MVEEVPGAAEVIQADAQAGDGDLAVSSLPLSPVTVQVRQLTLAITTLLATAHWWHCAPQHYHVVTCVQMCCGSGIGIRNACVTRCSRPDPCSCCQGMPCTYAHCFAQQMAHKVTAEADVQALQARGIKALFPIQKSVFDPAMAGTDLVGRARTGSGKTLAFSLPIIEGILAENKASGPPMGGRSPRAAIICPTRELAKQVALEFESETQRGALSVLTVYGGTPIGSQIAQCKKGVDVLVGTPGRVLDLVIKRRCA